MSRYFVTSMSVTDVTRAIDSSVTSRSCVTFIRPSQRAERRAAGVTRVAFMQQCVVALFVGNGSWNLRSRQPDQLDACDLARCDQPLGLRVFDDAVEGLPTRGCLLSLVSIGWVLSIELVT
jgi:hypothetical protein